MRSVEDCLNDHFNITQEEREEAKGQWAETIRAFIAYLKEEASNHHDYCYDELAEKLEKELGDKTT